MNKLKPCPFCGGEAVDNSYDRLGVIKCKSCEISITGPGILSTEVNDKPIPYSDGNGGILDASEVKVQEYYHSENKDKLYARWNTRHQDEENKALRERVQRLEGQIEDVFGAK